MRKRIENSMNLLHKQRSKQMITRKFKLMTAMLAVLAIGTIGCSEDDKNPMSGNPTNPTKDIVEIATAAGNFKTLLAAAEEADLVDALKGAGPITVFAPTDEAFAKLPAGTVEALLADKDALTAILTYHVVPGAVTSDQVVKLSSAETLNGSDLTIAVTPDGKVKIDNAMVTMTDIKATNGIIHVIDAVLIPGSSASARTIPLSASASLGSGWIAQAVRNGNLNWFTKYLSLYTVSRLAGLPTLTTAVQAAGLQSTLMYKGPFTLFGPTEQAFAALPAGTVEALLKDPETLSNILLYHVTPGVVKAADVVKLTEATMANGKTVKIAVVDGKVKINDATVLYVDIAARNGVLHIIDGVLIPQ
jgi:transforming growth factor-beta-induced protein